MDLAKLFLIFCIVLAGLAAICAVLSLGSIGTAGIAAKRMQKQAGMGNVFERVLRNGVLFGRSCARFLMRYHLWESWCTKLTQAARIRGYVSTPEACGSLGVAWFCLAMIFGTLVASPLAGLALAGFGIVGVGALAEKSIAARTDALRDALPDALRIMSACFHAGFSLSQTFAQVAHDSSGPLAQLFDHAFQRLDTGVSAREALEEIRREGDIAELAFLSVALEVQHRAGGSMQHVLDATRESLESELELRRALKVHTAQARLSAHVVVGVTLALVLVLSLLTENFLAPFFSSWLGICLFTLALAMQVAGILAVRRLLNVEVG